MATTELPQGATIGSYRVIRRIGQGGMGVVYEVEHIRLGTRHALKTFSHEGDDAGLFRKRFLAEGRLLARLNHPRIVRVHDMDLTDDGLAWFAMDLVLSEDGKPKTLADVPRDGSVPEERLAAWFEDVREALGAVHKAGVVHRDVKLENMLLGADGHAYLADFGISKIADRRLREELSVTLTLVSADANGKSLVGTSAYLPPEVRQGRPLSCESDYYSLGVSFFRLLTGLWYSPGPHAFDLLSPFGKTWRRVLGGLLEPDPSKRRLQPVRQARRIRRASVGFWTGLLLGVVASGLVAVAVNGRRGDAPAAEESFVAVEPENAPEPAAERHENETNAVDLSDFDIPDSVQ